MATKKHNLGGWFFGPLHAGSQIKEVDTLQTTGRVSARPRQSMEDKPEQPLNSEHVAGNENKPCRPPSFHLLK